MACWWHAAWRDILEILSKPPYVSQPRPPAHFLPPRPVRPVDPKCWKKVARELLLKKSNTKGSTTWYNLVMANKLLHGLSRLSHPHHAVPPSQPSPAGSRHPLKVKLHAAAPERWKRWKLGINGNWTFGHLDSMEFNGIQWNPISSRNPEIHGMVRNGSMAHRINGSTRRPPAHVWPVPSRLLRAFFPAPRQKNPSGTSYCSNTEAEKPWKTPSTIHPFFHRKKTNPKCLRCVSCNWLIAAMTSKAARPSSPTAWPFHQNVAMAKKIWRFSSKNHRNGGEFSTLPKSTL